MLKEPLKEELGTAESKGDNFEGLLGTRGLIGQWSQQKFEREDSRDFLYEYTQQTDEGNSNNPLSKVPTETEDKQNVYSQEVDVSSAIARNKASLRYASSQPSSDQQSESGLNQQLIEMLNQYRQQNSAIVNVRVNGDLTLTEKKRGSSFKFNRS